MESEISGTSFLAGHVTETVCNPGCARRMLLGPTSRSLQDTDEIGTTTFVLSFSGSETDNLSDTQLAKLIKDGEEIIEAFLIGEGIDADIDFDGLAVVEPPVEAPSGAPYYSTKKGGKKSKKDKKGGKSAKKKKSSSSKSSKKKAKSPKLEKKVKGSKW